MCLRQNRKSKGFTLIEILIALFIFTLVAMIMTHALRLLGDAQEHTQKKAERLANLETALLLFSRDIEQVMDRPIKDANDQLQPAFQGKRVSCEFTHGGFDNPFGTMLRSTLQRTGYRVEKHQLIRDTWPVLDRVKSTEISSRVLLEGVDRFQLEYLDEQGKAYDIWPDPDSNAAPILPRAVRIRFSIEDWGKISQIYLIAGQSIDKTKVTN